MYCGEAASSRDHFVPRAFKAKIQDLGWAKKGDIVVPACRECNSTANDKVFGTLREKRAYVHDRYRKKYAKVLAMPRWSDEELAELGPTLRTAVVAGIRAQESLKARLRWPAR